MAQSDLFEVEVSTIRIVSSDIEGIHELESAISYNKELGIYTIGSPKSIKIHGGGFTSLFNTFLNNFEDKYPISIFKNCNGEKKTIFTGKIFLSDCIFEVKKCEVEVQLVNLGFQEKVNGNLETPVSMTAEQTKNSTQGVQISLTPPSKIYLGSMFFWDASTGLPVEHNASHTVFIYDLKDCFEQILSYISDNTITFESDWYNGIGATNKIGVTTGEIFRSGSGNAPILNLRDLFLWCKNLFGLVIVFDVDTEGNKRMRVEKESYLESNGVSVYITQTNGLKVSLDQSKLYNSVRVGSNEAFNTNGEIATHFQFPKVQGSAFGVEEFAVQSVITVQSQLDLTVDVMYDHNKLEDMAINNTDSYDDKIIFIQYTETTNVATTGDILGVAVLSDADYFYNQCFINSEILKRHSFYAPLVLHIQDGSDTFFAQAGILQESDFIQYNFQDTTPTVGAYIENTFLTPMFYPNDFADVTYSDGSLVQSFDANNNYGNGTAQGSGVAYNNSKYVSPADGVYSFECKTKVNIEYFKENFAKIQHKVIVTDSVGTIKNTYTSEYVTRRYTYPESSGNWYTKFYANNGYANKVVTYTGAVPVSISFDIISTNAIYLDTNDRVYVEITVVEMDNTSLYPNPEVGTTGTNFYASTGSGIYFHIKPYYFACTRTTEGQNIQINTEKPAGIYQLNFDTHLTESQVSDILGNSNVNVIIDNNLVKTSGIVESMQITHKDNLCTFVVGSRKVQNGS